MPQILQKRLNLSMKNKTLSHFANKEVLKFYGELPFNYYESVEGQSIEIKNSEKNLKIYGPLIDSIKKSDKIVDMGCGPGYLTNMISFLFPQKKVLGLDFNPVAIKRATEVSNYLKLNCSFIEYDIFKYTPRERFDLATSIGVLHHTNDCLEGIKLIIKNVIKNTGKIYIGLYNKIGRKPFLDYFEDLKKQGKNENEIFLKYSELHHNLKDKTHLKSWFRDQVLHPLETQHTFKEVLEFLDALNFKITYTSINKYKKIQYDKNIGYNKKQIEDLYVEEREMENRGKKALVEKRYYPGFFTFLAEPK